MKHVRKAGAPHDYIAWRNRVRGTADEDYRHLQNPEKASLQRALVREQGSLCAYTMRRIDESSSHIEHIKPEALCRIEQAGADLDYDNIVACFPREGMAKGCRYGAQRKDDWWEDDGVEFVSPMHPACESRFHFDLAGNITPVRNHRAAVTTIQVLALDHPSLTEDRKRVIEEFIYGANGSDPLSRAAAHRATNNITERGANGSFYEFCISVRDALQEYLKVLDRTARSRKFAGRGN